MRVQKSNKKIKNKTSSKRRCTETYLPPLWALLLTIRSTILSASSLIEFENLSASKLAKHLRLWIFEGTAWANLFEKGAMRTALKHGLRETIYSCHIQCNLNPWLKFKESNKSRIHKYITQKERGKLDHIIRCKYKLDIQNIYGKTEDIRNSDYGRRRTPYPLTSGGPYGDSELNLTNLSLLNSQCCLYYCQTAEIYLLGVPWPH